MKRCSRIHSSKRGQLMDISAFFKEIRAKRCELEQLITYRDTLNDSLFISSMEESSDIRKAESIKKNIKGIETIIADRITRLVTDAYTANTIIDNMKTPECRELLLLRYLACDSCKTWEYISKVMPYSVAHLKGKLHTKAINEAKTALHEIESGQTAAGIRTGSTAAGSRRTALHSSMIQKDSTVRRQGSAQDP